MIPKLPAAAAIACAIIALPAAAQEWRIELSNPTLTPESPSTEVKIIVYVPPPDYHFANAAWATHATEAGWDETSFAPLITHPGQKPGALSPDGRSVYGQEANLLLLFGWPEPNPLWVWQATFTVTDFSSREITISTETERFEVYVQELSPLLEPRTPIEGHAVIQVIPAPGTLAALALTALTTTRRRRQG